MKNFIFKASVLTFVCASSVVNAEPEATVAPTPVSQKLESPLMGDDFNKLPTYIKSDTLNLKSDDRVFVYSGNVEVKHGDMTLTTDTLEGKYSQNNKVELLTAKGNVLVLKGDTLRANGEKGVYEAGTEVVTLTENPELQQNGSVLTADIIKLYLNENRSSAEGAVRVKMVKTPGADGGGKTDFVSSIRK